MGLREEILALPAELLVARNDQAIAAALSVDRIKRVPVEIGKGKILETIGLEAGNALLDALDSAEQFRHARQLLANGWLRIDSDLARSLLDSLVPAAISAANAAKLKALGEADDAVSVNDVSDILNAEGF